MKFKLDGIWVFSTKRIIRIVKRECTYRVVYLKKSFVNLDHYQTNTKGFHNERLSLFLDDFSILKFY